MRKTRSNCRVGTFKKKNGLPPGTVKSQKHHPPVLEQDEIQDKVTITPNIEEVHSLENFVFKKWIKNAFSSKMIQHAGSAAAVVVVTIASSLIVSNAINKGGVQL